jgi:hypothetical protein
MENKVSTPVIFVAYALKPAVLLQKEAETGNTSVE